jgi:hypothetical protein
LKFQLFSLVIDEFRKIFKKFLSFTGNFRLSKIWVCKLVKWPFMYFNMSNFSLLSPIKDKVSSIFDIFYKNYSSFTILADFHNLELFIDKYHVMNDKKIRLSRAVAVGRTLARKLKFWLPASFWST